MRNLDVNVGYNTLGKLEEFLNINNIDKLYIITDRIVFKLYMDYLKNAIGNKDYSILL